MMADHKDEQPKKLVKIDAPDTNSVLEDNLPNETNSGGVVGVKGLQQQQQMGNTQMNPNQQQRPTHPSSSGPQQSRPQAMLHQQQQQQQQQQHIAGTSQQSGSGMADGSRSAGGHISDELGIQIQRRVMLLLLLHAYIYHHPQNPNLNREKYYVPYCKPNQDVFAHMATCKQSKDCTVQHCSTMRQFLYPKRFANPANANQPQPDNSDCQLITAGDYNCSSCGTKRRQKKPSGK